MIPRLAAAAAALAVLTFACAVSAAPSPSPSASPTAAPMPAAASAASPTPMPLTLAQAEDIAVAQSPALALARGQLAQAVAGIAQARAGYLPNVSASGSTSHSSSTIAAGSFGNQQSITSMNISNNGSLNLRQLIFDGGRIHDEIRAARLSSQASSYLLARQFQTVEFNVAQAYYLTLQARHQLAVAVDSLNLAQVQEKLVSAQYRAGVASHADVLTALLPVAQAQLAVAQAQNGEFTQAASMLNAMGLSAQTPVTVTDEAASTSQLPALSAALGVAMAQRPDLLAAQASKDAADASVRAAHLGLFPTVSGSASDSTNGSKSTLAPGGAYTPGWSVGASLSVPIFDGGLTRALTASAQAQDDQAAANLRSSQLLVSLNVQQAYLGVQTAAAGLSAADAELSQAKTVLDVTNAQYRSGVTTLPLLLNAQVGLTKAEGDQATAIYTYKTAWQQLLLSEGTIGPP